MDYCKDCQYYDDRDNYPNKGWCDIHLTYVKSNDACEDFEFVRELDKFEEGIRKW